MPKHLPESFGCFSTKLDLAMELALSELPSHRQWGFLSSRQSRHRFMKWALTEGICTLAKHFEDEKEFFIANWRFEIVQGPGVDCHFKEYYRRAEAFEKSLGESVS